LVNIDGPKLIALAWANSETGVLQDLTAIKIMAAQYDATCLVDASQVVGRLPFKADSTAYLTFSGHKLHGPKGIGVLVQPKDLSPIEVAVGGGQERGWRGGTLNVPGIVGLGVACELRHRNLSSAIEWMSRLRDRFESVVMNAIPNVRVNGADAQRVPNTTNITVSGVDGMALVARLEDRDILCSQVSACSSGQPEPSQTLLAMGRSRDEAYSSLRIALAVDTREEDVEIAAEALVDEALSLREMMGGLV
jgi:cysteine desulfurase